MYCVVWEIDDDITIGGYFSSEVEAFDWAISKRLAWDKAHTVDVRWIEWVVKN